MRRDARDRRRDKGMKLLPGKGDEPDTLNDKIIYVYDTEQFPFYPGTAALEAGRRPGRVDLFCVRLSRSCSFLATADWRGLLALAVERLLHASARPAHFYGWMRM